MSLRTFYNDEKVNILSILWIDSMFKKQIATKKVIALGQFGIIWENLKKILRVQFIRLFYRPNECFLDPNSSSLTSRFGHWPEVNHGYPNFLYQYPTNVILISNLPFLEFTCFTKVNWLRHSNVEILCLLFGSRWRYNQDGRKKAFDFESYKSI